VTVNHNRIYKFEARPALSSESRSFAMEDTIPLSQTPSSPPASRKSAADRETGGAHAV
jgi:hypothetical protein